MPRTRAKKTTAAPTNTAQLMPPKDGVTVRMYRTGHGDCFLLAFPGEHQQKPVYVLIDCGYKPGSSAKLKHQTTIREITAHIKDSTGGHIDVAVITHEHEDHVDGITKTNFAGISFGQAWFAWTEDPSDQLANQLRLQYKDVLVGLISAQKKIAVAGNVDQAQRVLDLLEFDLGDGSENFAVDKVKDPAKAKNKLAMSLVKELASQKIKYLRPHETTISIPGVPHVQVYVLGPPRDRDVLKDLDPKGGEGFGLRSAAGLLNAIQPSSTLARGPFEPRYSVPWASAGGFFASYYGPDQVATPSVNQNAPDVIPNNPDWRRIDHDWLNAAEQLALDMNDYTNNSSLVLAFELSPKGKVLLFAADAQRGNWKSWSQKDWKHGDQTITAKDLLARTVLYKVGHHGSHNATLHGDVNSDYPNLSWMGLGDHAGEFTAMITAVRAWAEQKPKPNWDHPLKAIKDALHKKASGRVFQTDTDLEDMEQKFDELQKTGDVDANDWKAFKDRTTLDRLYFDYQVLF
jgi:beta-lactamase superfamily II metal-dependent hydrolase